MTTGAATRPANSADDDMNRMETPLRVETRSPASGSD